MAEFYDDALLCNKKRSSARRARGNGEFFIHFIIIIRSLLMMQLEVTNESLIKEHNLIL